MKSSARRSKKYADKVRGFVLPGQAQTFAQSVPGQVQIEMLVKTAMAQLGIPAMFTNYCILFAKNIAKHIGIERDVEYNKWFQRGMRHDWLRWIGHTINRARLNTTGISDRHDPVGFWAFSRGSGSQALDYTGYDNHGTLVNSPTWVDGVIGNALSFDGVNQYVNCGNDPSLNFGSGNFTLMVWAETSTAKYQSIMLKTDPTWKGVYQMYMDGYGYIYLYFCDVDDNSVYSDWNVNLCDGEWHHYVGVREGSSFMLYVDSILRNTTIDENVGNLDNNANLTLGEEEGDYFFNGTMDEVRIWNRALSAEEIKRIYDSERL